MTANEIRQKFLDFYRDRGHAIIPSASLLPENDASTLFTSSGMQPLVPFLLGEAHPAGRRLADSQKCFRAGDIDEVGDNRHNTFFEMLGNWSLGDYFKAEQLPWFWEFLTKGIGLDPERLYVSVFRGNEAIGVERDAASVNIWKGIFAKEGMEARDIDFAERDGLQGGRIFYYDEKKNWWSRSGAPADMPVGEIGGPDSEVFYDLGADLGRHERSAWKDSPCHINCDCGRFIEVGNSVFIEFIRTERGFEALPQKNVDFGGGLERLAMVAQGKDNVFETDLFNQALERIAALSGKGYRDDMRAFEVIADHMKGSVFILADDRGVTPSNTDQGYVARRLIRRAIRYGRQLGIGREGWARELAAITVATYCGVYPELERNQHRALAAIAEEEQKFNRTLEKGLKEFEKLAVIHAAHDSKISAQSAFNLFQSFGFPVEMTVELAAEKGMTVDTDGFRREFARHQELSRTAAAGKFKGGLADHGEETTKLHTAAHLLLEALRRVLGPEVHQKGSNITAERLRFDFSWPEKMTDAQKAEVEAVVNGQIAKALPVSWREMTLDEAKAYGAEGVFDSKYGDRVKVYTVGQGDDIYSREICGGPHVENIGSLGRFRIVKEESSSAGVRRIKAVLE